MADEGKVFLDANDLYLDSFKLARAIWDDGFRPTVRLECGAFTPCFVLAPLTARGGCEPRSF